jgi:DNA repair photolyase
LFLDSELKTVVLKPVKRRLDDIVREFLAPFLDGRFTSPGWKLISWDAEQGISLTFESEQGCLLVELGARNDRVKHYTHTARLNVSARRQFDDSRLSEADCRLIERVVVVLRDREGLLPDFDRPTASRRTMVREILVDRVLVAEGKNHYYIDPYVGCMIGCQFCNVIDQADFSRRSEGLPWLPWGRYLDIKVNAADVLRRETQSVNRGIVRLSPVLTDPYQPAERHYRITRQCLEVLLETELAPVVLTRASRILDDIELLKRFRRAAVGFSIPTDADRYRQIFEPGADPIEERLDALRTFHAARVRTFAVIQPVLPMDIDRLVESVAPFVRAVRLDRMHFADRVQHLYDEHGLGKFATAAYADETIRRLGLGFRSRGVQIDSLDNLEPLLSL